MLDIEKDYLQTKDLAGFDLQDTSKNRQNVSVTCLLVPNTDKSVKLSPKSRVLSPRASKHEYDTKVPAVRGPYKKELIAEIVRLRNIIVDSEVQLLAERKLRVSGTATTDVVRTLNISLDSRRKQVAELTKENHHYLHELTAAEERYRHVWVQNAHAQKQIEDLKKKCLVLENQMQQTQASQSQVARQNSKETFKDSFVPIRTMPLFYNISRPQTPEKACSPVPLDSSTAEELLELKILSSKASPVASLLNEDDSIARMTNVLSQKEGDPQATGPQANPLSNGPSRFKFSNVFRDSFHQSFQQSLQSRSRMNSPEPDFQATGVEIKLLTDKLSLAEAQISTLLQELGTLRTEAAVKAVSQQVAESLSNDSKWKSISDDSPSKTEIERLTTLVHSLQIQLTDAQANLCQKDVDNETLNRNMKMLTDECNTLRGQLTAIRTKKFQELYPVQTERELRENLQDSEERRSSAQDRAQKLERRLEAEKEKMVALKAIFAKERQLNSNVTLIHELQDKVAELESSLAAARCDPLQLLCEYNGISASSPAEPRSLSTKSFRIEQEKIKRYPDLQKTVDIFEQQMKILTEEAYKNKILAEKWRNNKWAVDNELKEATAKLANAEKQLMLMRLESDGKGAELIPILEATQWELMRALCELGGLMRKRQNGSLLQAAFEKYSKAQQIAESQRENEGFVNWGAWEQEIAHAVLNMGSIRFEQKEYADAQLLFEKAYNIRLARLGPSHPLTEKCHAQIQRCMERMSGEAESDDAVEEYQAEEI